ncbi:MAG: hypothetical protein MRJ93_01065 [Nitrososphaeraceae archaeon]|nr:hypothetical protein [Nitrososphaeraceae archaeon]
MKDDKRITLMKAARDALSNSYSPYSNFKVGAAILTNNENIFSVCNMEYISYGLSMCA